MTSNSSQLDITIPLFKVFMPESVMEPLRDVLFSGYTGEGRRVEQFERELAIWFGNPNVLSVNTGSSALHLALRLAGVGAGDEVVSTPMTCIATNSPILALGAHVVWADIDPWTGNISPADVARKITPRTKAILAVHWGGYPCDLRGLAAVAEAHAVPLVEDACHALGAEYEGRPIGSYSDFVCFSFQSIKQMTTADGGALACKSKAAWDRGRRLRWYGLDRAVSPEWRWEQDIEEFGYKFNMNDVTATIGLEQLKYARDTLSKHRAHSAAYDQALLDWHAIRPLRYRSEGLSSYWLYTVRVKHRAEFVRHMTEAGIGVSRVHARNDRYRIFARSITALPGVDEFDAEQISIPCGWWLAQDDVEYIIETMRRFEELCTPDTAAIGDRAEAGGPLSPAGA